MNTLKKIFLLVDDDEDDRSLFSDTLKSIDSEIIAHQAINGREALEILSIESGCLPDLIFLDINMPAMSGWECLKKIKGSDHLRGIPVVVFTTSSSIRDLSIASELDASFYWVKPTSFKLLKDILSLFATKTMNDLKVFMNEGSHLEGLFLLSMEQ